MKKKFLIAAVIISPFFADAQGGGQFTDIPMEWFSISATLVAMVLAVYFIIVLIKTILEFRLRSKLIDKGVPDEVVKQFLQPSNADGRMQILKWALLLGGFGLGLVLAQMAKPYGLHSIAIMAFSVALSLLGYFLALKKNSTTP